MSNTPDIPHENAIEVIAPDGDVVLVVSRQQRKFRVSSQTLSAASPVFKAMLGPHFREGQQPWSSTNPIEVSLPEDSADGIELMCQLLHLCEDVGLETDTEFHIVYIRSAAVVVEKYQALGALFWQMRGMLYNGLFKHDSANTIETVAEAVAAAYLIGRGEAFRKATAQLINQCEDGVTELDDDPTVDIIPVRTLLMLEWRRVEARRAASDGPKDAGLCLRCCENGLQARDETCEEHDY